MALEERVEILEKELDVLKNQIQNTLLEVQEQLLLHYYPSLTGEGAPVNVGVRPRQSPTRGNGHQARPHTMQTPEPAEPPLRDAGDAPQDDEPVEEDEQFPQARQVSLEEVRRRMMQDGQHGDEGDEASSRAREEPVARGANAIDRTTSAAPQVTGHEIPRSSSAGEGPASEQVPGDVGGSEGSLSSIHEVARPRKTDAGISGRLFATLMKWTAGAIEAIGVANTLRAIEIYAHAGYLAPEAHQVILQLVSLGQEEQPPKEANAKQVVNTLIQLNATLVQLDGESGLMTEGAQSG
jgi:hypothetical protein